MDSTTNDEVTLHVGVHRDRVPDAVAALIAARLPVPRTDMDGWFSWGDPVGEAGNDADTLHLTWTTARNNGAALSTAVVAVLRDEGLTVAVTWPGSDLRVDSALTTAEDWSRPV